MSYSLLSLYILNLYLILDSIEIIINYNPFYNLKGLMSLNRIEIKSIKSKFLITISNFKHNIFIVYFRILISSLIFLIDKDFFCIFLFLLFIIELYIRFNFIDSISGSGGIILYSLFIFFIYYSFLDEKVLHLITFNLILAYVSNGVKKLIAPKWRDGTGLRDLMKTQLFGNLFLSNFLNNNIKVYKVLSWSIILFQCTFLVCLFNYNLLIIYLVLGVIFHLFIAFVYKLYDFLISFISSYPILFLTFNLLH